MRWIVGTAALVIAGWLGVQALGARADTEATKIVLAATTPSAQELQRAQELADRMARLNPDTRPEQLRGLVAYREGDMRRAGAIFEAMARDEPENLQAWALLARVAEGYDPSLAETARERVRALAPPVER